MQNSQAKSAALPDPRRLSRLADLREAAEHFCFNSTWRRSSSQSHTAGSATNQKPLGGLDVDRPRFGRHVLTLVIDVLSVGG
jgi:hypothetical protein